MKKNMVLLAMAVLSSIMCTAQDVAPQSDEYSTKLDCKYDSIESNNLCIFQLVDDDFIGMQDCSKSYIVYEIPNINGSKLKESIISTLSSMYKSPKDVINSISENTIQLDGYAADVYSTMVGNHSYSKSFSFSIIIQVKDGKVRYNIPSIKQIYTEWPLNGLARLDMSKPLSVLIDNQCDRDKVSNYFNNLIKKINVSIKNSDDW